MKVYPRVVDLTSKCGEFNIRNSSSDDTVLLFKIRRSELKIAEFAPRKGLVAPGELLKVNLKVVNTSIDKAKLLIKMVVIKKDQMVDDFETCWNKGIAASGEIKKVVELVQSSTTTTISAGGVGYGGGGGNVGTALSSNSLSLLGSLHNSIHNVTTSPRKGRERGGGGGDDDDESSSVMDDSGSVSEFSSTASSFMISRFTMEGGCGGGDNDEESFDFGRATARRTINSSSVAVSPSSRAQRDKTRNLRSTSLVVEEQHEDYLDDDALSSTVSFVDKINRSLQMLGIGTSVDELLRLANEQDSFERGRSGIGSDGPGQEQKCVQTEIGSQAQVAATAIEQTTVRSSSTKSWNEEHKRESEIYRSDSYNSNSGHGNHDYDDHVDPVSTNHRLGAGADFEKSGSCVRCVCHVSKSGGGAAANSSSSHLRSSTEEVETFALHVFGGKVHNGNIGAIMEESWRPFCSRPQEQHNEVYDDREDGGIHCCIAALEVINTSISSLVPLTTSCDSNNTPLNNDALTSYSSNNNNNNNNNRNAAALSSHSSSLPPPPSSSFSVTAVKYLSVNSNPYLTRLDKSVNLFVSLLSLDLSDNGITRLVAPLHLPLLKHLDLSRNRLKSLDYLQSLTSLTSLAVRSNQLSSARHSINMLVGLSRQLNSIDLSDNPICEQIWYVDDILSTFPFLRQFDSLDLFDFASSGGYGQKEHSAPNSKRIIPGLLKKIQGYCNKQVSTRRGREGYSRHNIGRGSAIKNRGIFQMGAAMAGSSRRNSGSSAIVSYAMQEEDPSSQQQPKTRTTLPAFPVETPEYEFGPSLVVLKAGAAPSSSSSSSSSSSLSSSAAPFSSDLLSLRRQDLPTSSPQRSYVAAHDSMQEPEKRLYTARREDSNIRSDVVGSNGNMPVTTTKDLSALSSSKGTVSTASQHLQSPTRNRIEYFRQTANAVRHQDQKSFQPDTYANNIDSANSSAIAGGVGVGQNNQRGYHSDEELPSTFRHRATVWLSENNLKGMQRLKKGAWHPRYRAPVPNYGTSKPFSHRKAPKKTDYPPMWDLAVQRMRDSFEKIPVRGTFPKAPKGLTSDFYHSMDFEDLNYIRKTGLFHQTIGDVKHPANYFVPQQHRHHHRDMDKSSANEISASFRSFDPGDSTNQQTNATWGHFDDRRQNKVGLDDSLHSGSSSGGQNKNNQNSKDYDGNNGSRIGRSRARSNHPASVSPIRRALSVDSSFRSHAKTQPVDTFGGHRKWQPPATSAMKVGAGRSRTTSGGDSSLSVQEADKLRRQQQQQQQRQERYRSTASASDDDDDARISSSLIYSPSSSAGTRHLQPQQRSGGYDSEDNSQQLEKEEQKAEDGRDGVKKQEVIRSALSNMFSFGGEEEEEDEGDEYDDGRGRDVFVVKSPAKIEMVRGRERDHSQRHTSNTSSSPREDRGAPQEVVVSPKSSAAAAANDAVATAVVDTTQLRGDDSEQQLAGYLQWLDQNWQQH